MNLFRPIGGGHLDQRLLSTSALDYLARGRYTCVLWNCIPRDWLEPDRWPATAMAELARRPWTLMVLHDLPSGAMRLLDAFIVAAKKARVEIVQDFPPDCVPIVEGRVVRPIDAYVATPA